MSTYSVEYYQSNKESILANQKVWREANPELVRELQKRWRESNEGRTYLDKSSGYVQHIGYQHPIANPSGVTPYHRIVLWDAMNGQDAFCHWGCGTWVSWSKKHPYESDALCVDHANLDKADNRPENLVPSCAKCNVSRPGGRKERKSFMKYRGITCAFETCDRQAACKDLCTAHYMQAWKGQELRPLQDKGTHMTEDEMLEIVQRVAEHQKITLIASEMGYNASTISLAYRRATGKGIRQFRGGRRCV